MKVKAKLKQIKSGLNINEVKFYLKQEIYFKNVFVFHDSKKQIYLFCFFRRFQDYVSGDLRFQGTIY